MQPQHDTSSSMQATPAPVPSNLAARAGRWSVRHRKTAIFGWLAFVVVSLVVGTSLFPQEQADPNAGFPGESGQASRAIDGTFPDKASEQVLTRARSSTPAIGSSRPPSPM